MAPKHSPLHTTTALLPPFPPLQDTTRPIQTRVPSPWAKPTNQLEITPEGGRERDKKEMQELRTIETG